MGGGGAFGAVLGFAVLGGVLRMLIFAILFVVSVIIMLGMHWARNAKLKALLAKSMDASTVNSNGMNIDPRVWGVYRVEDLVNGKRSYRIHIGSYPVRQRELVRQFGQAELVALYTERIDALQVADLLNPRRR